MTIGDYHVGDILFSTENVHYAYTVVEIDRYDNRVRLVPNYKRAGDKIYPDSGSEPYWRSADAYNLRLHRRKVAKVV